MIFETGHSAQRVQSCDTNFGGTEARRPATAMHLDFTDYRAEIPMHQHEQGQLVLALHGAVTCAVSDGVWIVPPQCGVWIPGGVAHSNRVTPNARLAYLFVEPDAAELPQETCTVSISPMVREMVLRLADGPKEDESSDHLDRLARLLLDELTLMPRHQWKLPTSDHPKISAITALLTKSPGDRRTIKEWAAHLAVSERSLKRLIVQETGLSFGRWRRQLHLVIALRELASGATVQRVAGLLGYESTTAFIVMFKKALGATPSRYLAQLAVS
jgi:AraC-like DNA-binding protein